MDRSSLASVTDAELIAELKETLRQRDARIAELERTVGELSKVIEAWKRGHRVRPGGKLVQKPRDKRKAAGRGPGRPEGHEGSSRPAPTAADRDVLVPAPETCACSGSHWPSRMGSRWPSLDSSSRTAVVAGAEPKAIKRAVSAVDMLTTK